MTAKFRPHLRIFLFGNTGHASRVLDALIARGEDVIGICCRGRQPAWRRGARRLVHALRAAGLYREPSFVYRDPFDDVTPITTIARRHDIAVFPSKILHDARFETMLRNLAPDVILVAGFHRLIPEPVLSIPIRTSINLHPSLLPRHRGGTPNRWIIRLAERESGVTAHILSTTFDTGAILLQKSLEVRDGETWGELERRVSDLMVWAAGRVLELMREDKLAPQPQREDEATYEPSYRGEHQDVDWNLTGDEIRRICYAIRPKSGGITSVRGRPLCLWEVEPLRGGGPSAAPGTVTDVPADGTTVVACGDGAVRIKRFLDSGQLVDAGTIVRRYKIRPGQLLG